MIHTGVAEHYTLNKYSSSILGFTQLWNTAIGDELKALDISFPRERNTTLFQQSERLCNQASSARDYSCLYPLLASIIKFFNNQINRLAKSNKVQVRRGPSPLTTCYFFVNQNARQQGEGVPWSRASRFYGFFAVNCTRYLNSMFALNSIHKCI